MNMKKLKHLSHQHLFLPLLLFQMESKTTPGHLVELFSSEGCSSCPPAEQWLSSFRSSKLASDLWTRVVPIEFHVSYWNHLGWDDGFSKEMFTSRQRKYAREWGTESVYTPGVVLDGREWRPYGSENGLKKLTEEGEEVGVLRVDQIKENEFRVRFDPSARIKGKMSGKKWILFGALLGNGLQSKITSGENAGRTLSHEFVVLSFVQSEPLLNPTSVLKFSAKANVKPKSYSVAFWVTNEDSLTPIQVLGGDLKGVPK